MRPELKMAAGPRLFDDALNRMRAGLRARFPEAGEEEIEDRLRGQLKRLRHVQEHNIYRPANTPVS